MDYLWNDKPGNPSGNPCCRARIDGDVREKFPSYATRLLGGYSVGDRVVPNGTIIDFPDEATGRQAVRGFPVRWFSIDPEVTSEELMAK